MTRGDRRFPIRLCLGTPRSDHASARSTHFVKMEVAKREGRQRGEGAFLIESAESSVQCVGETEQVTGLIPFPFQFGGGEKKKG